MLNQINMDGHNKVQYLSYIVCTLCLFALSSCVGTSNDAPDYPTTLVKTLVSSSPTQSTVTIIVTNTAANRPSSTNSLKEGTSISASEVYATPASRPTETISTPRSPISTSEPELEPTAEPVTQCTDTILTFIAEDVQKGNARWRVGNGSDTIIAPVEESNGVYQIMRSSDPASTLAVFSVMTYNGRPSVAANVLVNVATGAYRVLGSAHSDNPKYLSAWLPLNRLAWLDDQGEVYIGSIETQEALDAPARMTDLWFVKPDRLLTRDDTYQFWVYDRGDSIWYPALLPEENAKIATRWVENAAVADDGSYVFFFYQDYSALLFPDTGTVEIRTPSNLPADGYYSTWLTELFTPPQQIRDTPYWFFPAESLFREFALVSYLSKHFVVDSRTGAVLENEALGMPTDVAIYNTYLSPDEKWLAVEVVEATQSLTKNPANVSQTWYISPVTGERRVEDGPFPGWERDGEAPLDPSLTCEEREITIPLPLPVEG